MRTLLLSLLLIVPTISAQEGHPLVGSWHGSWGDKHSDVTLVMSYDGKKVSGLLNPGADAVKLAEIQLEPSDWSVHIAFDGKDQSGKPVHLAVDGKIENISNVRRSISGTWTQGTLKGPFKIVRDN